MHGWMNQGALVQCTVQKEESVDCVLRDSGREFTLGHFKYRVTFSSINKMIHVSSSVHDVHCINIPVPQFGFK